MAIGFSCGDDVRHSSAMLEREAHENNHDCKWNFLGNGMFLEGEETGLGEEEKKRGGSREAQERERRKVRFGS